MSWKRNQTSFSMPGLKHRQDTTTDIKITFIGDSSVGKTSMIDRIIYDRFDEIHDSTIGGAFCTHDIIHKDNTFSFKIWDTAGQERYKSLVPMYIKHSKIIIVAFSITNRHSYDNILKYWCDYIQETEPYAHIVLVGTKLDLESNRVVSNIEAKNYAKSNYIEYLECSSKNNTNMDKLLKILLNIAEEEQMKIKSMRYEGKLKPIDKENNTYGIIKLGETTWNQIGGTLEEWKPSCMDGCGTN